MPPRSRALAQRIDPDGQSIIGVEWPIYERWLHSIWLPGQHVAMIGPTGCGKSTTGIGITRKRKWVVALDAKGGDSTLAASGYLPVNCWPPPRKIRQAIAEGRPARLVVGFKPENLTTDWDKLRQLIADFLDSAWLSERWTIVIDECQILTDRKMMNLGPRVEKFLIAARDKQLSILNLYQAPAWVPTATTRQATYLIMYPTRDITVIKTLAERCGRDWHELRYMLHEIPDHYTLTAGPNPRDPLVLTKPPEV